MDRITKNGLSLFICFFVVCLTLMPLNNDVMAQPTRDRILGDLLFNELADQTEVSIEFTFPIRYMRHFPETHGKDLRIQLEPIAINPSDREALFKREAVTVDQFNSADISEVIYEGDNFSGFMLTVYFIKDREFTVEQGNDYRSIRLLVKGSNSKNGKE